MNILVSGGSGYIGSFVIKSLLEKGNKISILSRSENDCTRFYRNSVNLIIADITKPLVFETNENFDLFIHLAAANDIDSADPAYAINASSLGTRYALDFCKRKSIKKFIYFSTYQVYGSVEGDMDEKSMLFPVNDYGITHLFAEQYIEMYNRTAQIDYIILRPTNIFGSPMFRTTDRWSLVPSCFCKEAVEKGEINLLSSGKQARDFINVEDLASITSLYSGRFDEFKNSKVNIASGNNFTIIEIAEIVARIYESNYHEKCKVNIHSENPKESNVFYICKAEIDKTGFQFGNKAEIVPEIDKIFKLLNNN
jgi:UDP-glucose 4-epimerase